MTASYFALGARLREGEYMLRVGCGLVVLFVGLLAPLVAEAQNTERSVVAKADLKIGGKVFAHQGDVLTIETQTGNGLVLRTLSKERAQVRGDFVVALKDAAPLYTEMIREEPKDAGLLLARAGAYSAADDLPRAIADCTSALTLPNGRTASVYLTRGVFYTSLNDFEKAAADFRAALKIDDDFQLARINLANALMGAKDYDGAIAIYDELIEKDKKNPRYFVERGVAWRHKQDWDSAIDDFSRALNIDPKHLAALSSRGFVNYLKGDHAKAVEDFTQMIALQPEDALSYNNRGYNNFLMKNYTAAIADYDAAIKHAPQYAMAYQNKAWLLATCAKDEVRDGRAAFEAAGKACQIRQYKNPGDVKALAAAYAELRDFAHAVEFQQKVIDMTEGDAKTTEQEIMKLYKAKQPFRSSVSTEE